MNRVILCLPICLQTLIYIVPENQHPRNGDTLDADWPTGEETDFNMVLMNPPYSAKWSAAAGKIREKLFRSGNVYAVIGLPANLFYNTSIPTCIVVLKKHRDGRDVFEQEEEIDLDELLADMASTDEEINKVQGEFVSLLKDLRTTDASLMASLNKYIGMIEGDQYE